MLTHLLNSIFKYIFLLYPRHKKYKKYHLGCSYIQKMVKSQKEPEYIIVYFGTLSNLYFLFFDIMYKLNQAREHPYIYFIPKGYKYNV